jgi:hypothetical protein
MEASQRDTTDEWRITPARAPATVVELEGRIDLALATARAAEEAALEIGAAGLEAAQQAHRAAALAERASIAAARSAAEVAAARADPPPPIAAAPPATREPAVPVAMPQQDIAEAPTPPDPIVAEVSAPPDPIAAEVPTPPAPIAPVTTEVPAVVSTTRRTAARRPDPFDERITAFRERAEKVMIRLQKLEAGDPPGAPSEVVRLR